MTAQWIHDKARRVGASRELEHHVVHLVLAHHGRLEYGSPKVPMTLEAVITHAIDELDSRVNSWLNLMGKDGGSRRWTNSDNVYEQPIWRGALPTVQVEKKGPPAELMTPVIYVPRDGQQGQGPKKSKPPREKRRPEPRPPQQGQAAAPAATAPAEAGAPPAEGVQHARPERPERPARTERPDRGGPPQRGGFGAGGFGDKKRGYQGPRLPGDKGPQHRAPEKKSLTHNPFAALAQKLEDAGKPAEAKAEETPAAAEAPPASEAPAEATPAPAPQETQAPEAKTGE
jgi:3'-5' exoribonuclease